MRGAASTPQPRAAEAGAQTRGELLEIGETNSVLSNPSSDRTRRLVGLVPIPDSILVASKWRRA